LLLVLFTLVLQTTGGGSVSLSSSGGDDADLARKLQEEWEAEEAASIEAATMSGSKPANKAQPKVCFF
jgi:hypothetical protein